MGTCRIGVHRPDLVARFFQQTQHAFGAGQVTGSDGAKKRLRPDERKAAKGAVASAPRKPAVVAGKAPARKSRPKPR